MNKSGLITNKGEFQGGYFVLNENRDDSEWIEKTDLFVTLPYINSIKDELISLIRNSSFSIKLCSFILTDQDIYLEIEQILNNTNVAVFILTQLDDSKFSTSLLSEEEMTENFNQIHLDIIKKLYSQGAHVRATRTAHAKFIISDRKKALITSANVTTPSLTSNPETGIYISDLQTSKDLDSLFDEIFQNGTEYTKFISASSSRQFIISRQNNISADTIASLTRSNLRFTYEEYDHSLYNELIDLMENTKEDIYLSTYSIVGLEFLPEFVRTVKKKIEQGLSVHVFSRGMNYRADHLASCTQLAKLGCKIYGDIYNHSKGIITTERSMIFTANIDGNHGLKNGFEVGAIMNEAQAEHMATFVKWQIKTAPYVFALSPSKKSYFSYYSFYCREKEINHKKTPDNIIVKLKAHNRELASLIDETPCYLKFKNQKIIQLQIGRNTYQANLEENILIIGERISYRDYNLESYLLCYDTIKIIFE
ncbi:phospholipase D-like domain-containing protein [Gelidibacter pelagius]|uniref:phospholipase D n=1 Tax=Gelidibacter pelagius TaxID=2819985 RepID=A0ABS3SQ69_9FLAO|nr:phospholipase D-like domain-containing protein [Gelidibacter pelagius]MBO3097850.1 phospholipase D family protein [Gelidibacter pelagius]